MMTNRIKMFETGSPNEIRQSAQMAAAEVRLKAKLDLFLQTLEHMYLAIRAMPLDVLPTPAEMVQLETLFAVIGSQGAGIGMMMSAPFDNDPDFKEFFGNRGFDSVPQDPVVAKRLMLLVKSRAELMRPFVKFVAKVLDEVPDFVERIIKAIDNEQATN